MVHPLIIAVLTFMSAALVFPSSMTFALHDSNLDVNTWLASDNSTQLQTIDLNQATQSPSSEAGPTMPEDTSDDENGDETTEEETTEDTSDDENGEESIDDDDNTLFEGDNGNEDEDEEE